MALVDKTTITFAKAVRAERKRLCMTQDQLALAVGTTQQNVAGWEASKSLPRPDIFDNLVEVFGPDSVVAGLPPRGQIQLTNQATEVTPPASSAFMQAINILYEALPQDPVLRATVFNKVCNVILEAGKPVNANTSA